VLWIDTTTEEQVIGRDEALWNVVWTPTETGATGRIPGPREEDGEFWYDTLQREKGDAQARYEIARRHLPLPAAWREMAVALRAMIRAARKAGTDHGQHLVDLHRLAALWSFAVESDADNGRGYGLFEMTPYSRFTGLDLSWDVIGCDRLCLLKVTDRKWMREAWGEPATHSTARQVHADLYEAVERRVDELNEQERERRREAFLKQWDREFSSPETPVQTATLPGGLSADDAASVLAERPQGLLKRIIALLR
jgi:hypothetical protein